MSGRRRAVDLEEYVENVVYAPRKPTVAAAWSQSGTSSRCANSPTSAPSANEPLTLTTNVPHGNASPQWRLTKLSSRCRDAAPAAPKAAMTRVVRMRGSFVAGAISRSAVRSASPIAGRARRRRKSSYVCAGVSATSRPPSSSSAGKKSHDDALHLAAARAQLELLVEPAHAPLERELDGVLLLLEALQPERGDDVGAHHVLLAPAAQLEHAAAEREDPPLLVARHEARRRRGVVVVHQLEEEAETAAVAGDGLVVQALEPVAVDGPLLAVRADEVRHGAQRSRLDPALAAEEPELEDRRADDHAPGVPVARSPSGARACRRSSGRRGRR